jgi:zinc D-Ala-D-Ala carboxypeptidase
MHLSKHFTLDELIRSDAAIRRGIPNIPTEEVVQNLVTLCNTILEPLRMRLGKPIIITSGYRSPEVNALIGGSRTSQHMTGQAADFHIDGMTPLQVVRWIVDSSRLPYDQVIEEFGTWVHVSWATRPRTMALVAFKNDENETEYRRIA